MKLTEFIRQLQECLSEYGDLDVLVVSETCGLDDPEVSPRRESGYVVIR